MTPSPNTLFKAAQAYIAQGQPVFPCYSGLDGKPERAKAPAGSAVPHGVKDATLSVDQVRAWLKKDGTFALGLATGFLWDVLDVDIKDDVDGRSHLSVLQGLGLLNGCQRVVQTPSGGWHLYFRASKGMTNKGRAGTLGLDVRGLGGYVVAPPSYIITPNYAGAYIDHGVPTDHTNEPLFWNSIANSLAPIDEQTKEPIFLLPSERRASIGSLREWVTTLKVGERNNGFHWAVCRCIEHGIDPEELLEAASLIGLTDDEVSKTIGSALTRAGVRIEELDSEVEAMFPE